VTPPAPEWHASDGYGSVAGPQMTEDRNPSPPGLSVFFPAYNDSGTIASMVVSALITARTLTPDHEVIDRKSTV